MADRSKKMMVISLVLFAGLMTAGCVGMKNALSEPIKRTSTVALKELPRDVRPIKIALLSDIHVGNFAMAPQRLGQIVQQVNRVHPDVVVLAGDFIIGESKDGAAKRALDLAPLAGLRASDGVYAVLGNHDHWTDAAAIKKMLASAGVRVLDNSAVRLGPIAIVGIGDRFSGHDDIARSVASAAAAGGVPIAFTHSPDLSAELPSQFRLLLAGHTHCGQMVATVVGPIVRYSHWRRLYDQKYRCGRVEDNGRITIVTAGVGPGAVPLRFGAMPDWWLVEVGPKAVSDGVKY